MVTERDKREEIYKRENKGMKIYKREVKGMKRDNERDGKGIKRENAISRGRPQVLGVVVGCVWG